jgi:hypothetical protein
VDSNLVREVIRRKIADGSLPKGRAVDHWDVPGTGYTCDGCGEPMMRNQNTHWGVVVQDWMSIQLHADCFQIWEAERLALTVGRLRAG